MQSKGGFKAFVVCKSILKDMRTVIVIVIIRICKVKVVSKLLEFAMVREEQLS